MAKSTSQILFPKDSAAMGINNLSDEEHEKLAEFKDLLKEKSLFKARHEDQLLTRFLVARQWNLQRAAQMLEDCEKWREERKVDDLVANFKYPEIKEIHELLPRYFHKTDKLGRPLFIMEFDKADGNKIFKLTTSERLMCHHIRTLEMVDNYYLRAANLASPESNRQIMTIVDLKGAYLSQFHQFARLIIEYFSVILNNYPDQLGALRIINAPFLFTAIWRVIKVILDARTLAKIQIIGSDYEGIGFNLRF